MGQAQYVARNLYSLFSTHIFDQRNRHKSVVEKLQISGSLKTTYLTRNDGKITIIYNRQLNNWSWFNNSEICISYTPTYF